MKLNPLTQHEQDVILQKATETPFDNEYDKVFLSGIYVCRQCSQPLFNAQAKFDAGCGWPSFDAEYPDSITRVPDADGQRTEIICSNCKGHLGHVFEGEGLTDKNTRHCVNSASIKFIPQHANTAHETAYLAGGCFWCTEAIYKMVKGVEEITPGYSGGYKVYPTYNDVCTGTTGHAEAIKVIFNNGKVKYDKLLEVFFETHDPTTLNRQGADEGEQYRSVIFYTNLDQKEIAEKYLAEIQNVLDGKEGSGTNFSPKLLAKIRQYEEKKVTTELVPFIVFFPAEDYHKNYFENNRNAPYCRFVIEPKVEEYNKDTSDGR